MSPAVLSFSGSYLELLGWICCLLILLATAFAAGWAIRDLRDEEW